MVFPAPGDEDKTVFMHLSLIPKLKFEVYLPAKSPLGLSFLLLASCGPLTNSSVTELCRDVGTLTCYLFLLSVAKCCALLPADTPIHFQPLYTKLAQDQILPWPPAAELVSNPLVQLGTSSHPQVSAPSGLTNPTNSQYLV